MGAFLLFRMRYLPDRHDTALEIEASYDSIWEYNRQAKNMYPRVKVRVQREEADQYAFEKSSLQSLKAFEWLSLRNSSDESAASVVRIPRSYAPKTPPPSYLSSKEPNKETVVDEKQKKVRATSTPRVRAVLSSPENDAIIGSKAQTRRQLLTGLKGHDSCPNRHTQCKTFPRSAVAESFSPSKGPDKDSTTTNHKYVRAKGRTNVADSYLKSGQRKRAAPNASPTHN